MTTYNTGNPLGSAAAKDLYDNAQNLDHRENDRANETWDDRLGVPRLTWYGIEKQNQRAMQAYGWATVESFQDGATLTLPNEILHWKTPDGDGDYYRWDGTFPKNVPANSTPDSAGGVGTGKWLNVGDALLRSELAAPGGVNLVNGAAKQTDLDAIGTRVTQLEHGSVNVADFAYLVVDSDDWTAAIQAAFDTGKDVDGTGIYKVTGPLNTKGQRAIGDWKINATHLPIPVTLDTAVTVNDVGIRMMYVAVHYDYCEFLQIKSLGFNVLHHYCNFSSHQSGSGGTVTKMLDNAITAGMLVQLATEAAALNNSGLTLEQFVNTYDSHPAVMMYSVFDEPGTRGITVSDQDIKITTMRGLTSKPLTCVDLVVKSCPPFYDHWSKNYDVFFVDSYGLC